jgi:hypothetical protein
LIYVGKAAEGQQQQILELGRCLHIFWAQLGRSGSKKRPALEGLKGRFQGGLGDRRSGYSGRMRTVIYSKYFLPPPPGSGPRAKPYSSRWVMSPEDAAARGLGPEHVVPGTSETRQVPETEEERQRAQTYYQTAGRDAVKPPRV